MTKFLHWGGKKMTRGMGPKPSFNPQNMGKKN